jgi:hypothetical protein
MTKQITMKFRRDDDHGPACLEYSWVPEGKRHTILLKPGQADGSRTDLISDDLNPSFAQVYSLSNGVCSTEGWQFPPGSPYSAPVDGAGVDVCQQEMQVIGAVRYEDGTTARGTQPLEAIARPCPQIPPNGK